MTYQEKANISHWLVLNTALTDKQISEFCDIPEKQIPLMRKGEMPGKENMINPIKAGILSEENLKECENNPNVSLKELKIDYTQVNVKFDNIEKKIKDFKSYIQSISSSLNITYSLLNEIKNKYDEILSLKDDIIKYNKDNRFRHYNNYFNMLKEKKSKLENLKQSFDDLFTFRKKIHSLIDEEKYICRYKCENLIKKYKEKLSQINDNCINIFGVIIQYDNDCIIKEIVTKHNYPFILSEINKFNQSLDDVLKQTEYLQSKDCQRLIEEQKKLSDEFSYYVDKPSLENDVRLYNIKEIVTKHNKKYILNEVNKFEEDLQNKLEGTKFLSPEECNIIINNYEEMHLKFNYYIGNYLREFDIKSILKDHNETFIRNEINKLKNHLDAEIKKIEYIDTKLLNQFIERYKNFLFQFECVRDINSYSLNISEIINKHNKQFIEKEIQEYSELFNFENKKLNQKQKEAIVTDEISQLVVAGAGCGKTSMLLGKVRYLLKKGVKPSEIILLSFTKKTVADINNRLNKLQLDVNCKTFHSLGRQYTQKGYDENITVEKIVSNIVYPQNITEEKDEEKKNILKLILDAISKLSFNEKQDLKEELKEDILKYIAKYPRSSDISLEEGTHNLKDFNKQRIPTLKYVINKEYSENTSKNVSKTEEKNLTLKGETVKSLAEAMIANYLFIHDIDYKYEHKYDKDFYILDENNHEHQCSCRYTPDFCITNKKGTQIWLEHFSITNEADGIHARWLTPEDEKEYISSMKNKQYTHKKNNTILIETNSDDYHNNTLLPKLQNILQQYDIEFEPLSEEKILKHIKNLHNRQLLNKYTEFFARFISLFKSQSYLNPKYPKLQDLKNYLLSIHSSTKDKTQIEDFFKIIVPIYELYEETLEKMDTIDFNDMINKAIDAIINNGLLNSYKYIIVDEYQDITYKRYEFLHLLQEKSNAKIFCVGDDWQSIYGFNGSDISLFTDFNSMFPNTQKHLKLNTTYRNSNELINIAGNFIQKNPNQLKKQLISEGKNKDNKQSVKGVYYHFANNDSKNIVSSLKIAIEDILKQYKTGETICVIGRYNINKSNTYFIPKKDNKKNNDLYYIDDNNNNVKIRYEKYRDLDILFSTIHKAKGLEYDYAIFLDGDENFPYTKPEDFLLLPLLHKKETYPNEEERRMFYVALTRCKKNVYLLINEYIPSIFYKEIHPYITHINDTFEEYCKKNNKEICPICHNGIYQECENNENGSKFWACNNLNCNISTTNKITKETRKCPKCKEGYLVIRTGSNGNFLGCTNFGKKNCIHKEQIK